MTENSIPPERKCSKCGHTHPLTSQYFHKKKTNQHGFSLICKVCKRKIDCAYYENNSADVKERVNQYHHSHKHQIAIKKAEYYERRRDYFLQKTQQWNKDNPERRKALSRSRYLNNKEHRLRQSREWSQNNPEKSREIKQRWVVNNPDRRKEVSRNWAREHPEQRIKWRAENPEAYHSHNKRNNAKRRALMNEAEGDYTKEDLIAIYADQEGRCAYCGITLYWDIPGDIHLDHVVALTRGGSNWPDNLALTCASCNSSKQDKSIEEWQLTRGW